MIRRTSLNLDLDLVAQARDVLDTRTTTETVHRALDEVVRREALKRLLDGRTEVTLDVITRLRGDWFRGSE
jgi:Arc/MetJ family transcription regulator